MSENISPTPKKRRWYHNIVDAYKITARSYPWIPWAFIGAIVVSIALGIIIAALFNMNWTLWILTGLMLGILIDTFLLSFLVRRAMYMQIDGTVGAVYAVLSQINRGWVISEEPIAGNKEKDLVWRIIGRPGVVLLSEGPSSRVKQLLGTERRKISRVLQNVPIHVIQVGHGEGQVELAQLEGTLRKLKKVLTKEEVPIISQRLNALQTTRAPIPKGIDPAKVRMNRRALRGR